MTNRKRLAHYLNGSPGLQPAAVKKVQEMLANEGTEISDAPALLVVEELQSVWSIRLWNSVVKGRRIVGLRNFFRALTQLAPETLLQQTAVRADKRTALLFSDPKSREIVGVVISTQSAADRQASLRNLSAANGLQAPPFLAAYARH